MSIYTLIRISAKMLTTILLIGLPTVQAHTQTEQHTIQQLEVEVDTRDSFESLIPSHPGTFGMPVSVDYDSDGNLYVLDVSDALVVKLNTQMQIIDSFGGRGHGPGEMQVDSQWSTRCRLAVGEEILAVADNRGMLIHIYSLKGEYLTRFRPYGHVWSMDIGPDDRIFITTTKDSIVTEYDSEGEILRQFGRPLLQTDDYRYNNWRQMQLGLMPDDRMVLISKNFLTIQTFQNGRILHEHPIQITDLYAVCSQAEERDLDDFLGMIDQQTVADMTQRANSGLSPIGLISGISIRVAKGSDEIWVSFGPRLLKLYENGHISMTANLFEFGMHCSDLASSHPETAVF